MSLTQQHPRTKSISQPQARRSPEQVIYARIEECLRTLMAKRAEYTTQTGSRFQNFEIAAQVTNTTPDEALWGMLAKHLASVIILQREMHAAMMCRQLSIPETEYVPSNTHLDRAQAGEKFKDLINYLLLLEAMGEYYELFTTGEESQEDNQEEQHQDDTNPDHISQDDTNQDNTSQGDSLQCVPRVTKKGRSRRRGQRRSSAKKTLSRRGV